jgi:hypothetical protein
MKKDKKIQLVSLAIMGLVAGTMAPIQVQAAQTCQDPSAAQMQRLFTKLDASHQKTFNSMDCEGKNLAVKLAEQSCKGKNTCKGLNSCKTDKNSCAGLGSCAGTSKGPFTDKNIAIDVAQKHMAEKRKVSMNNGY